METGLLQFYVGDGKGKTTAAIGQIVRAHGAGVLNAAFSRAFSILQAWSAAKKDGLVLTLVGLGDVGGTALLALKLLGREPGAVPAV